MIMTTEPWRFLWVKGIEQINVLPYHNIAMENIKD